MRNRARGGWRVVIPVLAALAAGGCATPGPLHVYTVANPAANAIHDTGGTPADEIPSFLARDPFTDHFFCGWRREIESGWSTGRPGR